MKTKISKWQKLLVFGVLCMVLGASGATLYQQINNQSIALAPEDPIEAWSEFGYIIWQRNSTRYCSLNTSTNLVQHRGINLTQVEQNTVGNMSNGGTIFCKEIQWNTAITLSSNMFVQESYQGSMKIYTSTTSGKVGDCPTVVTGTFSLTNSLSEQTLITITPSTVTHLYNFYIDLSALTKVCTIKVYQKTTSGGSLTEIPAMRLSNLGSDDRKLLALKDMWIPFSFRITITSLELEGASRNIPYDYIVEAY